MHGEMRSIPTLFGIILIIGHHSLTEGASPCEVKISGLAADTVLEGTNGNLQCKISETPTTVEITAAQTTTEYDHTTTETTTTESTTTEPTIIETTTETTTTESTTTEPTTIETTTVTDKTTEGDGPISTTSTAPVTTEAITIEPTPSVDWVQYEWFLGSVSVWNETLEQTKWSVLNYKFDRTDNGSYIQCTASLEKVECESDKTNLLTVKQIYKTRVSDIDPTFKPIRGLGKQYKCTFTGINEKDDDIVYEWRKDNKILKNGHDTKYKGLDQQLLTVTNLTENDNGNYSCHILSNITESDVEKAEQMVVGHFANISITSTNLGMALIEDDHQEGQLECEVHASPMDNMNYTWYFIKETKDSGGETVLQKGEKEVYEISNASREVRGSYRCEIDSVMGKRSAEFYVDVYYGPKGNLKVKAEKEYILVNTKENLICDTTDVDLGNPKSSRYIWYKNNKRLIGEDGLTIEISPTDVRQSQDEYQCQTENYFSSSEKSPVRALDVIAPLRCEECNKTFKMKEKVISKITFIISGSCDNFDITLKDNNGEEIKPQIEIVNRNSSFGQTNATKVTHSFTPEGDNCGAIYKHNGTYTLTVKGMDRCPGVIDHEFEIYIEHEPIETDEMKDTVSLNGAEIELDCYFCAQPPLTKYILELNGKELARDKSLSVSGTGIYMCKATNDVGTSTYIINVKPGLAPWTVGVIIAVVVAVVLAIIIGTIIVIWRRKGTQRGDVQDAPPRLPTVTELDNMDEPGSPHPETDEEYDDVSVEGEDEYEGEMEETYDEITLDEKEMPFPPSHARPNNYEIRPTRTVRY